MSMFSRPDENDDENESSDFEKIQKAISTGDGDDMSAAREKIDILQRQQERAGEFGWAAAGEHAKCELEGVKAALEATTASLSDRMADDDKRQRAASLRAYAEGIDVSLSEGSSSGETETGASSLSDTKPSLSERAPGDFST